MTATQKTETKTTEPVVAQTASETPAPIPLKKICADLKIDPKTARRKLRAAWRREGSTLSHTFRDRWSGDQAYADAVKAILKPAKN